MKIKNLLLYIIGIIIISAVISSLFWLENFKSFREFINKIEYSTFDLRQNIISKYKIANKDIKIIAVDDESYEYIMNNYGSWPISRSLWADTITSLKKANAKSIIFDFLFIKPNLNDKKADEALIESIKGTNNVYLSMNFDFTNPQVRTPIELDEKFEAKINIENIKDFDNEYVKYDNVRSVMKDLSDVTDKIGAINIYRDEDGIIRNLAPLYNYQNKLYPNLSLLVGLDLLNVKNIEFKNNTLILDKEHSIPLDSSKKAIINWYGVSKTYPHIPFWKIVKATKENDVKFLKDNFENKIIYMGATTTSLSDIKSTPLDSNLSGVELNATFLNNILDNNFLKKS